MRQASMPSARVAHKVQYSNWEMGLQAPGDAKIAAIHNLISIVLSGVSLLEMQRSLYQSICHCIRHRSGAMSRRGWLKRTLVDMRHRRRRDSSTSRASRTSPNEEIEWTGIGHCVASFRQRSHRIRLDLAKIDRDRGCAPITKTSNESSCNKLRRAHIPAVWTFR